MYSSTATYRIDAKNIASEILSIRLDRICKGIALDILVLPLLRIPFLVQGLSSGEMVINVATVLICIFSLLSLSSTVLSEQHLPRWFGWLFTFLLTVFPYANGASPSLPLVIKRFATILYQFAICWIIYREIKSGDSLWISSLSKMMYLLVALNLYTILRYPGGLYHAGESQFDSSFRNWLFGYDNRHIEYFLFALLFNMLSCIKKHDRIIGISTIMLYGICLYSTITVMTATSLISLIAFGILVTVISLTKISDVFNIYTYILIYTVALIATIEIATGIVAMPDSIYRFVTNRLGKSATFSERSTLWRNALHYFLRSPIFGNGFEDASTLLLKIGHPSGPHNEIINILYEGGLLHIFAYLGMFLSSIRYLYVYRQSQVSKAITLAIISLLIAQSMRGCSPSLWLPFYLSAAYCHDIDKSFQKLTSSFSDIV